MDARASGAVAGKRSCFHRSARLPPPSNLPVHVSLLPTVRLRGACTAHILISQVISKKAPEQKLKDIAEAKPAEGVVQTVPRHVIVLFMSSSTAEVQAAVAVREARVSSGRRLKSRSGVTIAKSADDDMMKRGDMSY